MMNGNIDTIRIWQYDYVNRTYSNTSMIRKLYSLEDFVYKLKYERAKKKKYKDMKEFLDE